MRRMPYVRGVVVLVMLFAVAGAASAGPREERPVRDPKKREPIVKVVKRIIKSFGDGLVTPTP